jgi:hypothetical protein
MRRSAKGLKASSQVKNGGGEDHATSPVSSQLFVHLSLAFTILSISLFPHALLPSILSHPPYLVHFYFHVYSTMNSTINENAVANFDLACLKQELEIARAEKSLGKSIIPVPGTVSLFPAFWSRYFLLLP